MLKFLKKIITPYDTPDPSGRISFNKVSDEKKLQIATCALFLEVANADDEFSVEEREKIIIIMKKTFNLTDEAVEDLIDLSKTHMEKSISIYEFTDIVNKNFSRDQKMEVLKHLWRLSYIDDFLHKYEDYFIRKISGNLHLTHADLISAKMEVKEEIQKS